MPSLIFFSQETGSQNWIGIEDIKSSPIFFMVENTTVFDVINTPIPFQAARLNIGNAMDISTGIFTAPRKGIYFFLFTGVARWKNSGSLEVRVGLKKNSNFIAFGYMNSLSNDAWETFALHSILNLEAGDSVWAEADVMINAYIPSGIENQFSGWLLREDISNLYLLR